jgi:hypothetical protein
MTTTIDPTEIYFGAPTSLTLGGVDIGGTLDIPKVTVTPTIYTPDFINAKSPIVGMDIGTKALVEADFTVNQLTGAKLAWALPGSSSVVGTAAVTGGGPSTTVDATSQIGDTTLPLAATTSITPGMFLKVGVTGNTEVVQVKTVNTGVSVTTEAPMIHLHVNSEPVVQVDDAGTTIITWTLGRYPTAAYQTLELEGPGLDNRKLKVTILNAISLSPLEIPFSNTEAAGVKMKMQGRAAAATPNLLPFSIEVG